MSQEVTEVEFEQWKSQAHNYNEEYELYEKCMFEIIDRLTFIQNFSKQPPVVMQGIFSFEVIALQFRIICELILFSTLAVNKKNYSFPKKDISKVWKPSELIKKLVEMNPNYYPKPIKLNYENGSLKLDNINSGFLTMDDLKDVLDKCADMCHATNPFNKKTDANVIRKLLSEWHDKIERLLACHLVELFKEEKQLLIGVDFANRSVHAMYATTQAPFK